MLQNLSLASEQQYLCDVCSEAVTNPLCPFCITKEIDAWLTLYPNLRKELLPKIKPYLKKINEKVEDSTQCIKCKNKSASVCPYCFTQNILQELKKIQANKIILKEFLDFFNFNNRPPNPHAEKWGYGFR